MRLKMSNGLYFDPCNPSLLYDEPEQIVKETMEIKPKSEAEIIQELVRRVERLEENSSCNWDDGHLMGGGR